MSLPGNFNILNTNRAEALGVSADVFKALKALIQNGLYYLSIGNNVSALVAFSSAASLIFSQQQITTLTESQKQTFASLMQQTLGYVEQLQTKVAHLSPGGGKSSGGDKKDGEEDWNVECQNMCESTEPACISFKDVVGMAKEKELIYSSIIKPLVYPNLYTKSAKGVLLYGPPGTGKTYLMKAAMKELQIKFPETAQVLFFPLTGADLKGKYVGETEKKIVRAYTCAARRACQASDPFNQTNPCNPKEAKAMFEELNKIQNYKDAFECKPKYVSIIFIDEFDSIGGDRSKDESGLTANAVNTLLQMMDGVASFKNVITVAATNYPWNLDAALLRRFNEHIYCRVPQFEDVKKLITMEMDQRLKVESKTLHDYCYETVASRAGGKLFTPSNELHSYLHDLPNVEAPKPGGHASKGKGCPDSSKKNLAFPIPYVDKSYLKDQSLHMMLATQEMFERHYSNSDITSVMQKAYNTFSENCLRRGCWIKISKALVQLPLEENETVDSESYKKLHYVSGQTKFLNVNGRDVPTLLNPGITGFKTMIKKNCTINETQYAEGHNVNEYYRTLQNMTNETNKIKLDDQSPIFVDKTAIPSYFGNVDFPDEKTISHLNFEDKKYINMRYIPNFPSDLMFNDYSIHEMFFEEKQMAEFDTIKSKEGTKLDVIFTKVMTVTGREDLETGPSVKSTIETINKIIKLSEEEKARADHWKSLQTAYPHKYGSIARYFENKGYIMSDTHNLGTLPDGEHDKMKAEIKTMWDRYIEIFNLYATVFNTFKTDNFTTNVIYEIVTVFDKLDVSIKSSLNDIFEKRFNYDMSSGITAGYTTVYSRKGHLLKGKGEEFSAFYETIFNFYNEDAFKNLFAAIKSIPAAKAFREHKKIFYFKAAFYPYDPMWKQYRAGCSLILQGITDLVNGLFKKCGITKEDEKATIMSYLSKEKSSALTYLLLRTTHIGVANGMHDEEYFCMSADQVRANAKCDAFETELSAIHAQTSAARTPPAEPPRLEAAQKQMQQRQTSGIEPLAARTDIPATTPAPAASEPPPHSSAATPVPLKLKTADGINIDATNQELIKRYKALIATIYEPRSTKIQEKVWAEGVTPDNKQLVSRKLLEMKKTKSELDSMTDDAAIYKIYKDFLLQLNTFATPIPNGRKALIKKGSFAPERMAAIQNIELFKSQSAGRRKTYRQKHKSPNHTYRNRQYGGVEDDLGQVPAEDDLGQVPINFSLDHLSAAGIARTIAEAPVDVAKAVGQAAARGTQALAQRVKSALSPLSISDEIAPTKCAVTNKPQEIHWFSVGTQTDPKYKVLEGGVKLTAIGVAGYYTWQAVSAAVAGQMPAALTATGTFLAGISITMWAAIAAAIIVGIYAFKLVADKVLPFMRVPVYYMDRLFWSRFVRLFTSVKPEDDTWVGNLVFASMFETEYVYTTECNGNYQDNLPVILKRNYTTNLNNRVNFLKAETKEYIEFERLTNTSIIHPKLLTKQNADYRMFFNFYMDGPFISAAVKDYPSTWVPSTGKMLEDYDANRAAFLEKLAQKSQSK